LNATIEKFGYPDTLLREYEHWVVLLRPAQVTIGSMVLACKEDADALGAVSPAAWAEVATACAELEQAARAAFSYDKINYLALMMVDPHVHFHVIPRYAETRDADGTTLADAKWPGPPDVTAGQNLTDEQVATIGSTLRASWPRA
jgi:diadenosine tetraphosphate (Ap4A) HIT family hydrolase